MKKREQYKRLLLAAAALIILGAMTGIFAFVWFRCYGDIGAITFVRGNYVIIGLYAMMLFFFYNLYGGLKIGNARGFDILYSQIHSVLCVNAITYLQL